MTTPTPQNGSSLRYEHTDTRVCWRDSADTDWYYDADKKKCKRNHNVNERITEAKHGPDPVMPHMVLDFPDLDVRWPVPLEVGKGVENLMQRMYQAGIIAALKGSYARVAAIHTPVTSDGQKSYCVECGRRAGYPCSTLTAVLGEDGADAMADAHDDPSSGSTPGT